MTEPRGNEPDNGPVPVREAMGHLHSRKAADTEKAPAGTDVPVRLARTFEAESVRWIARVAGESAFGGNAGFARIVAVHFFREDDEPDLPRFEALLPVGRLEALYEEELVELLERAVEIDPPAAAGRDD